MKHPAHVWKHRGLGVWYSWVRDNNRVIHSTAHATHAEALHHALSEVQS